MALLGFKLEAEYEGMMGWHNDKTLFWIAAADAKGRKHKYRKGDIGLHHYAFRLRSRKDVDALQAFLKEQGGDHRRSCGRVLRRLLRRVLPRSRRHETRRHALRRTSRTGCAQARRQEEETLICPRGEGAALQNANLILRSRRRRRLEGCAAITMLRDALLRSAPQHEVSGCYSPGRRPGRDAPPPFRLRALPSGLGGEAEGACSMAGCCAPSSNSNVSILRPRWAILSDEVRIFSMS